MILLYETLCETSLIEKFLYPKYGPGQMWETVASIVKENGGVLNLNSRVIGINVASNCIKSIKYENILNKKIFEIQGDFFLSSMPI